MLSKSLLIDTAVELNLPPIDYFSLWEDYGVWQLELLQSIGMKKESRLLDIGCGALRLGIYALPYLTAGRYVGVDAYEPYLKLGRRLVEKSGFNMEYDLILSDRFEFDGVGIRYTHAIAQSVFTHLSWQQAENCISMLGGVLEEDGVFIFSYTFGKPTTLGFLYNGVQPMIRPTETDDKFFELQAESIGRKFERLPVEHPSGQFVGMIR